MRRPLLCGNGVLIGAGVMVGELEHALLVETWHGIGRGLLAETSVSIAPLLDSWDEPGGSRSFRAG